MEIIGKSSKFVSKIFDLLVGIIILLIILFSGYSLYTSIMLFNGAYVSDKLLSLKPSVSDNIDNKPSFDELKIINPDIKAWVTIDNTRIDYPVVQGKNNLEYINKDIYGNFALEGCIFSDSRNDYNFNDRYNLLYGHHIDNGGMFGDLQLFLDTEFFDNNKTGSIVTLEGKYKIDLFAVVSADGYDQIVFNPTSIKTDEQFSELISYINSKSVNFRDININRESKIIGLSTCTSAFTNGRTILYGVLKP